MSVTAAGHLLCFAPHLRAEVVPEEGVYLISERTVTLLKGEQAIALAQLLDGTRDLAGLIADRPECLAPDHIDTLVGELLAAGLLRARRPAGPGQAGPRRADTGQSDPRRADAAFWTLTGLDPSQLETFCVGAVALGDVDADELTLALRGAGLRVVAGQSDDQVLTVVACSDYLDPELARIDAQQHAAGRPWLLARPTTAQAWLGPLLRPGEGPCWHCLATRLRGHRLPELYLATRLGRPALPPAAALAAGRRATVSLLAVEAATWLAGHRHPAQDAIWAFDTVTLQGSHHPVQRRPQCAACGDPSLMARGAAAPAITLRNAASQGSRPDEHACEPPLSKLRDLVSPVTGLIQEVCRETREPGFVCSCHASYAPPAMPEAGLATVRAALLAIGSGKGTTIEEAEAGAVCEALERYSGHYQGDESALRASLRSLGGEAIHPNAVQLFHERQFGERAEWNNNHAPAHRVPEALDETADIRWTPVWSLTGQRRLLPTAMLYYNMPGQPDRRFCWADSNGAAAGQTMADAVLRGMYELIERDAVALWWYNKTRQPGLDLPAFGDRWINDMRARYASLHRQVWALDLTADLGVPVVAALSARTDKPAEDITFGFGANLDPRIALRRAVTELNQVLPSVASAGADGSGYGCTDPWALRWWRTGSRATQRYLTPDPGKALRTPADYGLVPAREPIGDVAAINAALGAEGMQALVLDQTRPDVDLRVAKVIVPGLRPHWARFGEGRLGEVPVRLGRLPSPTAYESLNPVPLPVLPHERGACDCWPTSSGHPWWICGHCAKIRWSSTGHRRSWSRPGGETPGSSLPRLRCRRHCASWPLARCRSIMLSPISHSTTASRSHPRWPRFMLS
jgi:ribosomal protein S12 methylthiotransferase accessory factor